MAKKIDEEQGEEEEPELDMDEMLQEEEELKNLKEAAVKKNPSKKAEPPVGEVKKPLRYGAFFVPARSGIADSETGEVIAEGDHGIYQALANIIESQERIENLLGSLIGN